MDIENISLFPILVLKVSNFLPTQQCNDILEFYQKSNDFITHPLLHNNAVTSHSPNSKIHDEISNNIISCRNFTHNLSCMIDEYTQRTGLEKCRLVNTWLNIQNTGSMLLDHMHPLSTVTGAIYVNVPNGSSPIVFHNPNQFIEFTSRSDYSNLYTSEKSYYQPMAGDLLLFPSWLKHGADGRKNNSENRVVISFNAQTVL